MDIPDIIDLQLSKESPYNSSDILHYFDMHNINISFSGVFLLCMLIFLYKNSYDIYLLFQLNNNDKDVTDNALEKQQDEIQDYKQQYRELQDIELTQQQLREINKAHTKLSTKNGDIIIKYNVENERYDYWCNDKTISYTYLDIAARKFAVENNCKQLCVDYEEECNLAYNKSKNIKQDSKQDSKQDINSFALKKSSVFAKLKSKKKYQNKNNKSTYIPEKSNTFKRCGKLSEYNIKPKKIKQPIENISYSDWKKTN